jgi:parvulin-like peptidyl-prolyl isomerase
MNKQRIPSSLIRFFVVAGLLAPVIGNGQGLPSGVIARIDGVEISESQLTRALKESGLPESPQLRQAMKAQLVSRELFRQAAARNKAYEKRPEVRQAMQEAHDLAISRLYLQDTIKPAPVTEDQIRSQYDGIIASLGEKEYKPRAIQVSDDETAQTVLAQIKSGADFAKLAQQYSLAPNKARGGALDWVSFKLPLQEGKTQNLPLPLAQAIVQLPEGGVTAAPVIWNNARYLIKLDQVRPTQAPKYDDVKAVLRQTQEAQALEKATAALVVELVKNAKIEQ